MSIGSLERLLIDKTGQLLWEGNEQYDLDGDGATVTNKENPLAGSIKLFWTDPIELWNWAPTVLQFNNPDSVGLVEPLRLLLLDGKWQIDSAAGDGDHVAEKGRRWSYFFRADGCDALYRLRVELDAYVVFDWTMSGDYYHAGTAEGVLERLNWLHDHNVRYEMAVNND